MAGDGRRRSAASSSASPSCAAARRSASPPPPWPCSPSRCSPAAASRSSPATRCWPARDPGDLRRPRAARLAAAGAAATPGAGAGSSSPAWSALMFVVWLPNQWDLDSRVDTDLTNQARIEGDLTDLVDAGAFEPLCGPIAVPNHRAVPRLAFGLDVRPTQIVSASEEERARPRLLRRPRQPLRDPQLHPRPRRPDRCSTSPSPPASTWSPRTSPGGSTAAAEQERS